MPRDGQQDRSSNLSNDTIAEWIRRYRTQKRLCEEANGVLRNIVKQAKANGVNTAAAIEAVKLTKIEPDDAVASVRDQIRYMNLVRIEVSADDIFGGWVPDVTRKTDEEDTQWEAEEVGYKAGRAGWKVDACPYPHGSELAAHWTAYWKRGQEAIAREMGPGEEPAIVSRERPMRGRAGPTALLAGPEDPEETVVMKEADEAAVARMRVPPRKSPPKRRGRPPGAKNKAAAG